MTDHTALRTETDAEVLLPGEPGFEAVRPAYRGAGDPVVIVRPPATLERLSAVKRAFDPENVLARNHNIV